MVIKLSQSVELKEFCKISLVDVSDDSPGCIELSFSQAAMVGFATSLLQMYDDIKDNEKINITTHPLQIDPAPNQSLGFYITPSSPTLMVKINTLEDKKRSDIECIKWEEIDIKWKNKNQYYNVPNPISLEPEIITLESYELSRKNIVDIKVFNVKGQDITHNCSTLIIELNRNGMRDLGSMLLVWANNCKEGDEYMLPHIARTEMGYNMGVVLTDDSILTKFKYEDLGRANKYDPRF